MRHGRKSMHPCSAWGNVESQAPQRTSAGVTSSDAWHSGHASSEASESMQSMRPSTTARRILLAVDCAAVLHSERARANPDGLALDDGVRRRSWAELADRTARFANWIGALGARPGDHVAVWMGNRAECVELMVAGIQAGVWLTPINWHLTRDEIAYVIADSGARVLFVNETYAALARELCGEAVVVVAGESLESALRSASDAPQRPDAPAGGPMIYTSGTTGRPKGVKRHRAATLSAARDAQIAYAKTIACSGPGPHLITGPCYHAAPLMFAPYAQTAGAPTPV